MNTGREVGGDHSHRTGVEVGRMWAGSANDFKVDPKDNESKRKMAKEDSYVLVISSRERWSGQKWR